MLCHLTFWMSIRKLQPHCSLKYSCLFLYCSQHQHFSAIWHTSCCQFSHLNSYHHGFGVSSEGILQQTGQFGVPVWNVCALAVDQGGDDVPQCGQGEVDLGCFLQALTGSSSLTLPL